MKRITKKQINKELPRRDYFRRVYRLSSWTGIIEKYVKTFESAYAYVEDGDITIYDYGYGDAKERKVVCPDSNAESIDITDIIEEWMSWNSVTTRKDVVDSIYELVNELK